jgi:hypothetical protein
MSDLAEADSVKSEEVGFKIAAGIERMGELRE